MNEKKYTPSYTPEFRERGVWLYHERRAEYRSDHAAYQAIAPKVGCSPDSLRAWCLQSAIATEERACLKSDDKARLRELERENRQLRQVNEMLKRPQHILQ